MSQGGDSRPAARRVDRRSLWRYLVAAWSVGVAFLLTLLLSPLVNVGVSPLFLAAVMFSAWRGGLGPGLAATLLSVAVSAFVFLPPAFSFRLVGDDLLELAVFSLTAVVISSLSKARERAEDALRRSEARYRAIFEHSPMGIALSDAAGRFVESNPALQRMLGYTSEELRRMTFREFTHPDDVDAGLRLHREMMEGKVDHYEHEKRYVRADGRALWGRLSASRVAYEGAEARYEVRMIENIDERKRAEFALQAALEGEQAARREAEAADELKDEFVAAVSHELRTPLTTIKTLTRVMLRSEQTAEERRACVEDISSECDRQIDLVLNLLDLSRIKAGSFKLTPRPVKVGEVLEECLRIERFEAEERRQRLSAEALPALPRVVADHGALRRALCGLVENAIKYTPDGGSITLGARADGDFVAVRVADDGRGIRAEDLPRIFEKFYRGRDGAKTPAGAGAGGSPSDGAAPEGGPGETPGVGLGLHLARNIVEQFGGRIGVESAPGRGSTFTVYLPVWREGREGLGGREGREDREGREGR